MILAAFLLAGSLSHPEPVDIMGGSYSMETVRRYHSYVICFVRGAQDRRSDAGSPEANMQAAKAACRTQYDSFVAGVVKDSAGVSDAASAAAGARALLDAMDARVVIGPPPPAQLAQLPVAAMVGAWRLGGGPLAVDMNIRFDADGSLVGTLTPPQDYTAEGLANWKIVSGGTNQAVLHASFAGRRVVRFERIPSFPREMDFINPADPAIQRFDLAIEDEDLLIHLVTKGGGQQLRFRRNLETAAGAARD